MLDKLSILESHSKFGVVHCIDSSSLNPLEIPMALILSITLWHFQGCGIYLSLHNWNLFVKIGNVEYAAQRDITCTQYITYYQAQTKPFFGRVKFVLAFVCFPITTFCLFLYPILFFNSVTFSPHQQVPCQYLSSN